ncbi:hypothetical protein CYMTET_31618 [Cymbomonas tetramitiformis]|uniref:Right handed beta helix domain-containing protein n=1 Tax=Cymbomonas tetramitiformis TaxID=36881 RepID=A0AAE0FH56_9CHLO|nr:hypothetical protein CYMTET_31618 [Cymbomonas tetramitiformis]
MRLFSGKKMYIRRTALVNLLASVVHARLLMQGCEDLSSCHPPLSYEAPNPLLPLPPPQPASPPPSPPSFPPVPSPVPPPPPLRPSPPVDCGYFDTLCVSSLAELRHAAEAAGQNAGASEFYLIESLRLDGRPVDIHFAADLSLQISMWGQCTGARGNELCELDAAGRSTIFSIDSSALNHNHQLTIGRMRLVNAMAVDRVGGAILLAQSIQLVVRTCEFIDNWVESSGELAGGAAVGATKGGQVEFHDSLFMSNVVLANKSSVDALAGGGAVWVSSSSGHHPALVKALPPSGPETTFVLQIVGTNF